MTLRTGIQSRESERPLGEEFRLLQVREVAGAFDPLELRPRYRRAEGAAIALIDQAVAGAPQHQGRNSDAMQPVPELGVVHVG